MTDRTIDARWTAVDDYITGLMIGHDAALTDALAASQSAHLPAINVTAPQGKFLHLLARVINATRILEIGTLGGYSTIWMARALPQGGRLVTIEAEARHASIARTTLERAGLSDIVDLREGTALEVLPSLEREHAGPFDLSFIDADKPNTPDYFSWALQLSRPGSVIVADNVVRDGGVSNAGNPDPSVRGMRRVLELMAAEPRVSATVIQTVGAKGYDGFAIALVMS